MILNQKIKITKLEIEEFTKEEVANITITLSVDRDSHYWNNCMKISQKGNNDVFKRYLLYFKEGCFTYKETVDINPATKGILSYLQELKEGKSSEDTVIDRNIIRAIKALDLFWN